MGKSFRQLLVEGMALAFLGVTFTPWIWTTNWTAVFKKYLTQPAVEAPPPAEMPKPRDFLPQWPTGQPAPKAEPSKPPLVAC
jgi:hypothetical protein